MSFGRILGLRINMATQGQTAKSGLGLGDIPDANLLSDEAISGQMTTQLPTGRQIARKIALAVGVIAAGALLARQLPGLEEIPHRVAAADRGWMIVALLLELASTFAFAFAFHGVYDRRTSARASTSMSMAVQGMNVVLPSGGA